jgi:hypothetical protein
MGTSYLEESAPSRLSSMADRILQNSLQVGSSIHLHYNQQWRTQEFCLGGGGVSTNSAEDRGHLGDLGAIAP